jgi:MSHA biogenesis protein MshG
VPYFAYKGRDARGELMQGVLEAADAHTCADQLSGTGVTPIEITATRRKAAGASGQGAWARLTE